MTEEIGSDRHETRRPTEELPALDLMKYQIRQGQKNHEALTKEVRDGFREIRDLVTKHMSDLRVGEVRMDQIDEHLENTDKNVLAIGAEVAAINADKRSTGAIVASILASLGTIGTIIWVAVK